MPIVAIGAVELTGSGAFAPNPPLGGIAPNVDAPVLGLLLEPLDAIGVVPQLGAGVKLLALFPPRGAEPKPLLGALKPPVAGVLGAVKLLDGTCAPPLFAPAIFSCVRPNAAIPNTAPIAMWNKPAPCSVNGFH